jgi:Ran GTPase-activating protein (RanGAP) involved in mRNA processing and transport
MRELASGIQASKSLTYLNLQDNQIEDDGIKLLFETLNSRPSLEVLLLSELTLDSANA